MPALPVNIKLFIVKALASGKTPQQVACWAANRFGVKLTRQQCAAYDPTRANGKRLSPALKSVFYETRLELRQTAEGGTTSTETAEAVEDAETTLADSLAYQVLLRNVVALAPTPDDRRITLDALRRLERASVRDYTQLRPLVVQVLQRGPASLAEVVEESRLERGQVELTLDRLREDGQVEKRSRPGMAGSDRRLWLYALKSTPDGGAYQSKRGVSSLIGKADLIAR